MSTVAIPESLCSLVDFLNALESRVPLERLRDQLSKLETTVSELKPFAHFGDACYRRNLICEGRWYELLCICWRSGQRSPIHNHANSTCGLRVMQGVATETLFTKTPCGQFKATRSSDLNTGQVCCSQDADVHQVSNLQGAGENLMTLHIYSPPLRTMDTFSITGEPMGKYSVDSQECPEGTM